MNFYIVLIKTVITIMYNSKLLIWKQLVKQYWYNLLMRTNKKEYVLNVWPGFKTFVAKNINISSVEALIFSYTKY